MELFDKIVEKAKEFNVNMYSLCEIYNGKVRCEDLQTTTECHDCYSVAKAFTVTALGILYDRGMLKVTEKIVDIFADELPENYEKYWDNVTIENVIKHQAGIPHGFLDEDTANLQEKHGTDDYLKLLFTTPCAYVPGKSHAYSDGAYYLLGRVVTKKTGERLDDFMMKNMFAPLKFRQMAWGKCPKGYTDGASALYITTRDMAKLGEVYLNGGVCDGVRIISQDWVDTVIREHYEFWPVGQGYHKGGMHGQELIFSIKTNRVIAYHSCDDSDGIDEIIQFIDKNDI